MSASRNTAALEAPIEQITKKVGLGDDGDLEPRIPEAQAAAVRNPQRRERHDFERLRSGFERPLQLIGENDEERHLRMLRFQRSRQDARERQVVLGDDGSDGDAIHGAVAAVGAPGAQNRSDTRCSA